MSPGPPLANSSEAPERSHSRAPSASLQRLWDASLMRSRLAFKKVGPEDCGLRQKASQVYARGGLAGTGRPSTRFQRSSGMLRVHSTTSRAYGLIRVERLTRGASFGRCRAETGAVMGWARCRQRSPGRRKYKMCDSGCLCAPAPGSTCQVFGVAAIVEVAVSECVDAFSLYGAPLSSASAKRSSSP